jgi:hypothetical protein
MLTNSVLQIPVIAKRFKFRDSPSKFLKLLQNHMIHILSLRPAVGLAAAKSLANLGIGPFVLNLRRFPKGFMEGWSS